MPDTAIKAFAKLLQAELESEQRRAISEVMEVEADAQRHGVFNGSRRMLSTAIKLGDSIVRYRKLIFEKWAAYVRPRMSSSSATDQADFVATALRALDRAIADAQNQYRSRAPFQSMAAGFEASMIAEIVKVGTRERGLLESELSLYMTTPTSPPPAPSIVVSTSGSHSPVNVGSGSVSQTISTAEGMGELVTALAALLEAMPHDDKSADLRQVVIEAKDEAAKPQPNRLKLKGLLTGTKDAVQTVSLSPGAWEAVHRVGQALGVL